MFEPFYMPGTEKRVSLNSKGTVEGHPVLGFQIRRFRGDKQLNQHQQTHEQQGPESGLGPFSSLASVLSSRQPPSQMPANGR